MVDKKNSSLPQNGIQVLEIVGCFLMFFGALLLISVGGAKTVSDRVTNLISALVLLAVGVGMFWRGVVHHRARWLLPVVLFGGLAALSAIVSLCISRWTEVVRPPEKAASSESAKAESDQGAQTESGRSEETERKPLFVEALRRAGWAMRDVVEGISLAGVKVFAVIGFLIIAAVVWLVRRETVFEGVPDRKWWRDPRLWTAVIMATQIVIYLLLGT